jgi:hypothetical protein
MQQSVDIDLVWTIVAKALCVALNHGRRDGAEGIDPVAVKKCGRPLMQLHLHENRHCPTAINHDKEHQV